MEVKEEKYDFVKLEPTSIDNDDRKKPFFTSVDNPIKDETCMIKKEKEQLIDMEPTYEDISIDEKSTNIPLLDLVPFMKNEHQDETCQIKKEKEQLIDMEPTYEDISIGEKSTNIPLLDLVPFMKNEHQANSLGGTTLLIRDIKEQSTCQGIELIKAEKEETQDFYGDTKTGISNSLIQESNTDGDSCVPRVCTKNSDDNVGVEQQELSQKVEDSMNNTFLCGLCDRSFHNQIGLSKHTLTHGKSIFSCEECCKSFSDKSDLVLHLHTHTGERPFVCEYCNKSFSQSSVLKNHIRTHTGERPFVCEYCNKSFSQVNNLKVHIHTHTGERPFVCEYCNKSFSQSSVLKNHIRTHTGEHPFICNNCTKSFTTKGQLKAHLLCHC